MLGELPKRQQFLLLPGVNAKAERMWVAAPTGPGFMGQHT
jgi:hypothetical protein